MKAELKRLYSPDASNLATFEPDTPTHFGIVVQAMVGPVGDTSEESFDLFVCSPSWISQQLIHSPLVPLRHHLAMAQYSYDLLLRYVTDFCARCDGPTWSDIAGKLSRLGHWEFEDYVRNST